MCTKSFIKRIILFILLVATTELAAGNINFTSYNSINSTGQYIYNKSPLVCNYTNQSQKSLCNNGKDWAMSTAITSCDMIDVTLQINGITTLTDSNLVRGFIGGAFVIANVVYVISYICDQYKN